VTLATGPAPVPSNRLPPLSTSIAISFDFPAAGSGCDGVEDRHKSPGGNDGRRALDPVRRGPGVAAEEAR